MKNTIDTNTLRTIMELMRPAPIAPVAPIAPIAPVIDYTKTTEGAFGMAKDIQYLTKAVDAMQADLKKITDTHVTLADMAQHKVDDEKKHHEEGKISEDHESRINKHDVSIAKIQTWGAAALVLAGIAQALLFHYWK